MSVELKVLLQAILLICAFCVGYKFVESADKTQLMIDTQTQLFDCLAREVK